MKTVKPSIYYITAFMLLVVLVATSINYDPIVGNHGEGYTLGLKVTTWKIAVYFSAILVLVTLGYKRSS